MKIEDEFRVDVPIDEAWKVLLDVERIAPCMPGAQLQEIEGDEYRGIVKIKVGPITAQYKGAARIVEADETAHQVVLKAEGRDTRGQGNASATVTASLTTEGTGTIVHIDTDLNITGKVAQFGRGVMADVSSKLLGQFAANLERDVLSGSAPRAIGFRNLVGHSARAIGRGVIVTDRPVGVNRRPRSRAHDGSTRPNQSRWTCSTRPATQWRSASCRSSWSSSRCSPFARCASAASAGSSSTTRSA